MKLKLGLFISKIEKSISKPINLDKLVGKIIIVKHDYGICLDSILITPNKYNEYKMLSRITYKDPNTQEIISGHDTILVKSITKEMTFYHLNNNLYRLITPNINNVNVIGKDHINYKQYIELFKAYEK